MLKMAIDPDYERVSGRARVRWVYDWRWRCYYRAVVIDIGRYDGVAPAPEAAMKPEVWEGGPNTGKTPKTVERAEKLRAYLRQHGPLTMPEVAEVIGLGCAKTFLHRNLDLFVQVGWKGHRVLWGLA
jgi:hypothetical protein